MGALLKGKGKVAIVAVQPGSASTMAREEGFEKFIKSHFPNIQIVDKRYGMAEVAQSLTVAENMLSAFPELDAFFASNESSTMGAMQALKGRHSKVQCVGFDWSPSLKADLESGALDSVVVQNPFQMGYEAVTAAVDKMEGKPVQKTKNLEPHLVRREDLAKPEIQELLNPDLKKYLD
jgi:ribose transport system substrate-binding protein